MLVQGGGGKFPKTPSHPTNKAVATFLREKALLPEEAVLSAQQKSVAAAMYGLMRLQGCQLWTHAKDLIEEPLTKEQARV